MENNINSDYNQHLLNVAKGMVSAATTAPKGKGVNNVETKILIGEEIQPLIDEMEKIANDKSLTFFQRDANNLKNTPVLVLIGTKLGYRGIPNCGLCGQQNCADNKAKAGICAYDTTDLGIAIGYASSYALDNRVDHRVFFSAGKAALNLKVLPDCKILYAIPISINGKNIYYDRG